MAYHYDSLLVGECLIDIEKKAKARKSESLDSLRLSDMEEMYSIISEKDFSLPHYKKYLEDLKHYNANYKRREDKGETPDDVTSEEDKKVYIYMGYLIRNIIARYKLENKPKQNKYMDSTAILENFHKRLGNLESNLPAPHHGRRLP